MIVNCCRCGRYVGEVQGKLLKGWAILCPNCNEWREEYDSSDTGCRSARGAADMPEFLKTILR